MQKILAAAFACVALSSTPHVEAASVISASPQGEVAQLRQVRVRFSEAVVPFGDLRQADPFAVSCRGQGLVGHGRWIDSQSWVYDFEGDVGPGVRCTAQLRAEWKPDAKAVAGRAASAALSNGRPVTGTTHFAFSTGGPAVRSLEPSAGQEIEEDQNFLIRLSGPVVEASVVANAWCEVEGLGERLPLRVVTGDVRATLLQARRIKPAEAVNLLIAACARPLPNGAAMRMIWGKGIAAAANPQVVTSIQQRFRYTVRAAFTAEFTCEREKANAPCLPIRPMTVRFSAPISRTQAALARLKPAAGDALAPVFDKDDRAEEVSEIAFPKPLAENAAFTVELPPSLKDAAGRVLANAAGFPLKVATGRAPPIAKFAAAPFGIVERNGDSMLPVTLRHVQPDLRGAAAGQPVPPGSGGAVRDKVLLSDADMLAWYAKVQDYHEAQKSAKELGYPQRDWYTFEDDTDSKGRPVKRRVERMVGTRELSLLAKEAGVKRLDLPQLAGGDPRPFEVVGIPLAGPGYHVVEIESLQLGQALLDKKAPMYVRTGALVTNLGVHFKLGHENSLVWVTTLDRGQPVEGASVVVNDCNGNALWNGRTNAEGLAVVAKALDAHFEHCVADSGLFVTARKADADGGGKGGLTDVAFVFSSWQKGIESWRFNQPTGGSAAPTLRTSTVFDRTLFRAGETVSMKHFIRAETSAGLAPVPADRLPKSVTIVHAGSGQRYSFALQWNRGGRSATTTWSIPPAAKLGVYRVVLNRAGAASAKASDEDEKDSESESENENENEGDDEQGPRGWTSGTFQVEEFRLPLVDAKVSGPKAASIAPRSVAIDVQMNYFSGGPMGNAPLHASALLKARSPSFAGYDEFSFARARDPKKNDGEADDERDESGDDGKLIADKLPLTTDKNGAASFVLKDLPKSVRPSEIDAEVTFFDPNGETQTVSSRIDVWPSAVVLGVKASSWTSNRGSAAFSVVALDTRGKPIKGQAVVVRGRVSQTLTTRKRMVGGFYAYDDRTETKDLGTVCSGTTDGRGLLQCSAALDTAGQVQLIAEAKDAQGNPVQAAASVWITKQGELWFGQENDDRIDVLPEKKRYEPGEIARLQVRMPFREATVLVAIEREGVIATKVMVLHGDGPTVALKVEPTWGPNVFVSVLALRGRVRETPWYSFFTWGWQEPTSWWRSFRYDGKEYQAPTAMVDLSKPAFKLGVAALKIGLAGHELQVSVSADKPQYLVRQKAVARIRVTQNGKPVAGAQVAFAAVDEGLLALRGNDSWNLLEAMLQERPWGVETSTAQSEIIGRRHYGRKAVAAGGGGGAGATRELFDTLLVWKANVELDANGEAVVEVPLNDSLTSFRLVAIADADVQKFGTGSTSIRVSKDLQVLAGLPPLVREGDQFAAMLTLRNTTTHEMKVHATLQGTANLPGREAGEIKRVPLALPAQDVALPAGAATEVSWPVNVPFDAFSIVWEAGAADAGGAKEAATDRLKVTQFVAAAVPVRVLQATLAQLDGTFTLPIAAPADALPASGIKRGGINVSVQPKLSGALPGLRRYFETYPFICLEQKTSKSVGLKDAALWAQVANTVPTYLDSDGLASYFPPQADEAPHGSDTLTAYVLAATNEAGFALPAAAQSAMLDGLAAFVEGRIQRKFWSPRADLDVRKLAAMEALARYGRAQPRMLGAINITPNVWPTAAVINWLGILKRVDAIPDRAHRLDEAQQILRGRMVYAGTTMKFSTEEGDFWWWLMDSADANSARLILAVIDDPAWKDELPKMVVGSLSRQRRGAWLTTTANLWGSLALDKFAAKFESVPVAGRTLATTSAEAAAAKSQVADWRQQPNGAALKLAWPASAGSLSVMQDGTGKPWLTVQSLAAIPLTAPLRAGYSVGRSVSAVEQKEKGKWSRGDVMKVHLEIEALGDMTWVVVSDPVPGGATILGGGLGRDSQIAVRGERGEAGGAEFNERGFEAFRSYYGFFSRGKHVVEYTVRLNNPGRFALPPTRVEAMYAPETFGELPNESVEVAP